MKKNKAIFFDRDGVLIEAPIVDGKPKSSKYLNQIVLCKNIKEICEKYKNSYLLIMVTNQPDFKRGINTKKNIEIINGYLKKKLKLDDVFVCYSDDERCFNRKPNRENRSHSSRSTDDLCCRPACSNNCLDCSKF